MRVIGIISENYSGSTVLCRLFTGINGCLPLGETAYIAYESDSPRGRCGLCLSKECPIWSDALLGKLRTSTTWWEDISKHTGATVLISSDKSIQRWFSLGLPSEFILLWKNPLAWVTSYVCHTYNDGAVLNLPLEDFYIHISVARFNMLYRGIIRMIKEIGRPFVKLCWDNLCTSPEREFSRVCNSLGLDFNKEALDFRQFDHHHIGGNGSVRLPRESGNHDYRDRYLKQFGSGIALDTRYKDILTPKQIRYIEDNTRETILELGELKE